MIGNLHVVINSDLDFHHEILTIPEVANAKTAN